MFLPIPTAISLAFIATTFLTLVLFYLAGKKAKSILILSVIILFAQSVLGLLGFYADVIAFPPHFPLLLLPAVVIIVFLFTTKPGRNFLDELDIKKLALVHLVRIPVEVVLYLLFLHKMVPEIMTFSGRNFDILAGITSPMIYFLIGSNASWRRNALLIWNFACLGLLFNVVTYGILSAPLSFQQFGFEQPNVAVIHFPFIWLPSFVVPVVLLAHLASIRQLLREKRI